MIDLDKDVEKATGSDLKVALTCPECGASGWVKWKDLRGGLRCPKCQCHFLLNRSGKLQPLAELPHISYTCPRCKQSGSLPAILAVRKTECSACNLPLVRGPDQRLHEIEEARQMQQAALAEVKKPAPGRRREKHMATDNGRLRKPGLILAALVGAGLVCAGALVLGHLFDNSPQRRARAFTYTCLAGNQDGATAYLEDDAIQRAEFARWRIRYFPSILNEHRPAGDTVRVAVESISQTSESSVLRVTMTSRFIGTRAHEQHWQKTGNQWFFDAAATIRSHDRPL